MTIGISTCPYSECCYADRHYAECRQAERRGAIFGPPSLPTEQNQFSNVAVRFALEWVVQSITPVTDFKLQYRRVAESYVVQASANEVADNDNSWTEASVSPTNNGDHFYSGKFVIESLDPASHYVARISSNNAYGYGPFSTPFRFATKGAGTNFLKQSFCEIFVKKVHFLFGPTGATTFRIMALNARTLSTTPHRSMTQHCEIQQNSTQKNEAQNDDTQNDNIQHHCKYCINVK
jgi:hypothetical protein